MSAGVEERWHRNIAPASKYPTIFEGRNKHVAILVTKSHLWTEEQLERNANLIAAAPELLEALKDIVAIYEECCAGHIDEYETAKAAITKAEGK